MSEIGHKEEKFVISDDSPTRIHVVKEIVRGETGYIASLRFGMCACVDSSNQTVFGSWIQLFSTGKF